jgi:DnaK suppressor protein
MDIYKQKLEEEKKTLLQELMSLGKKDPVSGDWEAVPQAFEAGEADPNTNADRFEDFEEKSALVAPLEAKLDQVEHALARIEAGTFGICRVCGNEIEEARLTANPSAETCIAHVNE